MGVSDSLLAVILKGSQRRHCSYLPRFIIKGLPFILCGIFDKLATKTDGTEAEILNIQAIPQRFEAQRAYFQSGATLPLPARRTALRRLKAALRRREGTLCDALYADFGKCAFDAYTTELLMVEEEIDLALRRLGDWAAPRRAPAGLINLPACALVHPEPLGTVLVLSPWNYPILLALSPLVGALAAGNCAVLRPSTRTARTCEALCALLEDIFPPELVLPVRGGHDVGDRLLSLPFDLIFFTGGAETGKRVMRAAAEHLTPVVLELGGKSPCIVDCSADLRRAARRIVWAKLINAGQTCVAPDYLLVDRAVAEPLLWEMKRWVARLYYVEGRLCENFPQIITAERLDRLAALLEGEEIFLGGEVDRAGRRLSPTILYPVAPDAPCMQEELFGPVMPVIPYGSLDEALSLIAGRPKPLALYHFSRDRAAIRRVLRETTAGGGCVNDAVMQVSSAGLPFGGVGMSGMGRYHGRASFDTFSNLRGVLHKSSRWELPLKYPPHPPHKLALLKRLLGK